MPYGEPLLGGLHLIDDARMGIWEIVFSALVFRVKWV